MAFVDCAFETSGGSNGANKACGPSVQWDECTRGREWFYGTSALRGENDPTRQVPNRVRMFLQDESYTGREWHTTS